MRMVAATGGLQIAAEGRGLDGDFAASMAFPVGVAALIGWLVWGATVVEQPGTGLQWHL
jgi:hypothetical protein